MDAVIAASACSHLHDFQSGGFGNGGILLVYNITSREDVVFNALERAPSSIDPARYARNFTIADEGADSIGIPGEVAGWHEAWKRFGRTRWENLFLNTLCLCLRPTEAYFTLFHRDFSVPLAASLNRSEGFRRIWFDSNCQFLSQRPRSSPELCQTIQRISRDPESYYRGDLAKDILQDIADEGGNWNPNDLAKYTVKVSRALRHRLPNMGNVLLTTAEPTLGRVLGHAMRIIDGFRLSTRDTFQNRQQPTVAEARTVARTYHKVAEALKFAFGLRSSIGDFSSRDASIQNLMNTLDNNAASWADADRSKIQQDRVLPAESYFKSMTPSDRAGLFDIIDDRRMLGISSYAYDGKDLVAISASISGSWIGSKRMGRRTGIIFNNAMSGFSQVRSPISRTQVNWVKPNAQPVSTLVPAILLDASGGVKMFTCAAGGAPAISSAIWNMINHHLFGDISNLMVSYPRLHATPSGDVYHELLSQWTTHGNPQAWALVASNLTSYGHTMRPVPDRYYTLSSGVATQVHPNRWTAYSEQRKVGFGVA